MLDPYSGSAKQHGPGSMHFSGFTVLFERFLSVMVASV
jgi:hypothetical protein